MTARWITGVNTASRVSPKFSIKIECLLISHKGERVSEGKARQGTDEYINTLKSFVCAE